jgi:adenylate cyclase
MTKLFHVPVLWDEPTVQQLASGQISHWCRSRRLARVQPYGMNKVLTAYELLPSEVEPRSLKDGDRRRYEAALDAFLAGRSRDAGNLLRSMPPGDGPTQFLQQFMEAQQQTPPADWDGVVVLRGKQPHHPRPNDTQHGEA